jgi:hypothetical protein
MLKLAAALALALVSAGPAFAQGTWGDWGTAGPHGYGAYGKWNRKDCEQANARAMSAPNTAARHWTRCSFGGIAYGYSDISQGRD